ncbi:MAG: glycosyltransferase family 2 protein [Solirubrobacteraceae bacterium]
MSRSGFVILSTDEAPLLEHSLACAVREGFDAGLVIDNASTDGTAAVAAMLGVEVLRLDRRVPYTEAMNHGLRALDAELVAMLQADTFVSPGYLEACSAALSHRAVGSVAPKLVRALGPSEADRLALLDAAAMTFDRRRKNSLVGHGEWASEYSVAAEVFGADGAAALWRRAALEDCAIEGDYFDQNMPGWGCDADLAWRAQLFGWHSRYAPDAVVHHIRRFSPTTRASSAPSDRRTQFRNRLLMIAKNDSWRDLARDVRPLLSYEFLAFGYALGREPELLGGYGEVWRRLPEALRQRRLIQARRRVRRVPFGLEPPPCAWSSATDGGRWQ